MSSNYIKLLKKIIEEFQNLKLIFGFIQMKVFKIGKNFDYKKNIRFTFGEKFLLKKK